jgi:hypothetical protein
MGVPESRKNFLVREYKNAVSSLDNFSCQRVSSENPNNIQDLDNSGVLRESHILGWQINCNEQKYNFVKSFLDSRRIPLELLQFFKIGFCNLSSSLIFPLRDRTGTLLGICRRKPQPSERYYFSGSPYPNGHPNYSYTRVEKTRCLWGLWEQRHELLSGKPLVVVEGFFDVLRLRSYGIFAVAKLGSKLTDTQAAMLLDISNPVVLWPDNDQAGKSGVAEDVSKLLLHPTLSCVIPTTEDPGETTERDAATSLQTAVSAPNYLSRLSEIMYP